MKKRKWLNLGPKMPYFDIFDKKFFIWVFLGKNVKRTIIRFEISTLKFVYFQNFTKKTKMPKFGTKNVWFMYFLAGNWKQCCHIWNQHLQISVIETLKKQKWLILGPKMPYFGIFDKKFFIWVFLGKNVKRTIIRFEISTLKFL